MKKRFSAVASAVLACSCSSAAPPGAASCPVSGTYEVSYQRDGANPGRCNFPNGIKPDTATVTLSGTQATVFTQGEAGSCAGEVDANCKLSCKQALSEGDSVQISWTFSAAGITGSDAMYFTSLQCDANWNVAGARK